MSTAPIDGTPQHGPTGHGSASDYAERAADPRLGRLVVCTWTRGDRSPPGPVLPDGCIDLVWDGTMLVVAGPDTRAVEITRGGTFAGVRFAPGAASSILCVPASALRDLRVPLAELWGPAAHALADELRDEPPGSVTPLERALLLRMNGAPPPDPLVSAVVRMLARGASASDPVRSLSRALAATERTLRRRCVAALGYGPKTLDRIFRFRRALRCGLGGASVGAAAAAAGYADQAHLTRECRALAGTVPSELFSDASVICASNGAT